MSLRRPPARKSLGFEQRLRRRIRAANAILGQWMSNSDVGLRRLAGLVVLAGLRARRTRAAAQSPPGVPRQPAQGAVGPEPQTVAERPLPATGRTRHRRCDPDSDSGAAFSAARRNAAAAIRDARAAGHRRTAAGMARTAKRTPDLRAEKVVSHRYGFVWIANPKVASNSILEALLGADPTARAVRYVTLAELYAAMPETRDYVSFAFVRHPYARTRSCHASKLRARTPAIARRYHGLRPGLGIDDFCAWLATPWGSDAFADRHWLSQSVLLRENACSPLPDFIGRCESLDADLRAVADRLRMPTPGLARRNRSPAWRIPGPNAHSRMLLAQRYAEDFALGGYDR